MTVVHQPVPPLGSILVPWKQKPQNTYKIINANVIEPVEGVIISNATVRIAAGRVESVEIGAETAAAVQGEIEVDLKGKYLCPGLIDCHVHLAAVPGETSLKIMKELSPAQVHLRQPFLCQAILSRGFTTVRDCGGASLALKEAIDQGIHAGPRLFFAGHALSQTGGHGDQRKCHDDHVYCGGSLSAYHRIVDGVAECLKFTREELRQGADFIKIMGGGGVASPTDRIEHVQFTDEEVKAIVTVAANAGTYVTAHAYTPDSILQAIRQGVRGIEHGNLIDAATAKEMAERNVYLTPTLVTYATMANKAYESFLPKVNRDKTLEVLAQAFNALRLAKEAGVKMVFGTDLLGPFQFNQNHEFVLRSRVLSAADILRSATVTAAELLGQQDFLGQIKPGFAADFIVLEGNPLEDICILDKMQDQLLAVVQNGRVITSKVANLG